MKLKILLLEVNLGTEKELKMTSINGILLEESQDQLVQLIKKYRDCFAWDYHEMPELSCELVEHWLPIKEGYRPHKQPARRFNPELLPKIKGEIKRLLKVGFIRTTRYVNWLSNVVPVIKKNGQVRICMDFRNLNMLVDAAASNGMLTFTYGNSAYNQIYLGKEDIHKIAFHCLGFIRIFEWVVMPFILKNVGATYQKAMNLIFHDLISKNLEVYIDDVFVKLINFKQHLVGIEQSFMRMRKHSLKMNPTKCAFRVSASNFLGFLIHN